MAQKVQQVVVWSQPAAGQLNGDPSKEVLIADQHARPRTPVSWSTFYLPGTTCPPTI